MIDRVEKEINMLDRHLRVLETVIENEPIGIGSLADRTDYPEHKVRYSLRVLEEGSMVQPTDAGAITTDEVDGIVNDHVDRLDATIDQIEEFPDFAG